VDGENEDMKRVKMIIRNIYGECEVVCRECGKVAREAEKVIRLKMPYCGSCDMRIDNASQNYCGYCGKELDWDNKEEEV